MSQMHLAFARAHNGFVDAARLRGPIGGRIVGEVLVGLLELDPSSVCHAPQSWKPSATLVQLLTGLDRGRMSTIS